MHLWYEIIIYANTTLRVMFIDVLLESGETELVSIFEVSIVGCMLLNCIVRQMYESVINVLEINTEFS